MMLTYKANATGTLFAAYCGACRIGYVEHSRITSESDRWIWSLNTVQPKGGRATGIVGNEATAKSLLEAALYAWLDAAGLEFKSNSRLMDALQEIAAKRKMDATAAVSMKAIATKAIEEAT
jgi:hypothetical protein